MVDWAEGAWVRDGCKRGWLRDLPRLERWGSGWRVGTGLRIHESERGGGEGEEAFPVV